jgi:hypothetical protein
MSVHHRGMARQCIAVVEVLLCITNCRTAYAFNFGVMQLGNSGFTFTSSQVRHGIALDLAKSRNNRPVGLTPSSEMDSRKIFDEVINNNDFKWTQIKDDIDKDFSLPNNPIFDVDYEGQDERYFADQIVRHRIIPILQRAKVNLYNFFF